MRARTLLRLRSLGWFLFTVGVVVFFIGTDEVSGGWMGAGLALSAVGGVLVGLRYIRHGRAGDEDPADRHPR